MFRALRRLPFTLGLWVLVTAAGIYTRSHAGLLDAGIHRDVAYSARHLWSGQVIRLFTSLIFTAGGWRFYVTVVMLVVSVGWAERIYGPLCTLLTFFLAHLSTLLIMGLIAMPLKLAGGTWGHLMFHASDVGPSAGYYGCLALAMMSLPRRNRYYPIAVVFCILVIRLVVAIVTIPEQGRTLSANLAHLISFGMVVAILHWFRFRPQ